MGHRREDSKAEIDAMVADLEAENAPEIEWAVEKLRDGRAELDELDAIEEWSNDRQREWAARLKEQTVRYLGLAAHGRLPREGETASDLEREAERLARGKLRPELTEAEREEAVGQLRAAAQLVRDRAALMDDVDRANAELAQKRAAFQAKNDRRAAALRNGVRATGSGTTLWRLNQERRRENGRGRRK
jgi:hypothetical protein